MSEPPKRTSGPAGSVKGDAADNGGRPQRKMPGGRGRRERLWKRCKARAGSQQTLLRAGRSVQAGACTCATARPVQGRPAHRAASPAPRTPPVRFVASAQQVTGSTRVREHSLRSGSESGSAYICIWPGTAPTNRAPFSSASPIQRPARKWLRYNKNTSHLQN